MKIGSRVISNMSINDLQMSAQLPGVVNKIYEKDNVTMVLVKNNKWNWVIDSPMACWDIDTAKPRPVPQFKIGTEVTASLNIPEMKITSDDGGVVVNIHMKDEFKWLDVKLNDGRVVTTSLGRWKIRMKRGDKVEAKKYINHLSVSEGETGLIISVNNTSSTSISIRLDKDGRMVDSCTDFWRIKTEDEVENQCFRFMTPGSNLVSPPLAGLMERFYLTQRYRLGITIPVFWTSMFIHTVSEIAQEPVQTSDKEAGEEIGKETGEDLVVAKEEPAETQRVAPTLLEMMDVQHDNIELLHKLFGHIQRACAAQEANAEEIVSLKKELAELKSNTAKK